MLSDYLTADVFNSNASTKRDNLIAYNGSKSAAIASALRLSAPQFSLVPLRNLNRDDLLKILSTAKIYIDFGPHPGKDRLPREAAIRGCVVVTNKRGAASNEYDIPIPTYYKHDESDIDGLIQKLKSIISSFADHSNKFETYRNIIKNEKTVFMHEVGELIKSVRAPLNIDTAEATQDYERIDRQYLLLRRELDMVDGLANFLAVEIERLMMGGGMLIDLKNDIRLLYAKMRRVVRSRL